MNRDPWCELTVPSCAGNVNGRRVDLQNPWNFFWARDTTGKYLLVLLISPDMVIESALPKLKGIDVGFLNNENEGTKALTFTLGDSSHWDIFYQLCLDIVATTAAAPNERAALDLTLKRTWRWHHLLRGGTKQRLSEEEQMGLIGELFVIEKYLLPNFNAFDAISAWHGPLDSPKDFAIARVGIEAKVRRGEATPFISISSEFQLDEKDLSTLFLCIFSLDRGTVDFLGNFSVSLLAERIRRFIDRTEPSVINLFESRLSAAGFRWEDDYSDSLWLEGSSRCFRVTGQFPRIVVDSVPRGVNNLKYMISLAECASYKVSENDFITTLRGASNVEGT